MALKRLSAMKWARSREDRRRGLAGWLRIPRGHHCAHERGL